MAGGAKRANVKRKKEQSTVMMEEIGPEKLPIDIMEEILSRLPVKSLMRFRCVSKQWQNLFTDPVFVVKHMKKNPNPTHILEAEAEVFDCFYSSKIESYITKTTQMKGGGGGGGRGGGEGEGEVHSIKKWGRSFPRNIRFQASCDGLVCLGIQKRSISQIDETDIWLYNPATREKLLLPRKRDKASTIKTFSVHGLGVNPITKEYKVVEIAYNYFHGTSSVMIYTVGDGSHKWKHVCDSFPYILGYAEHDTSVCVGGSLHWLAAPGSEGVSVLPSTNGSAYNVIVYFDLHRQVLQEMPSLPFYQSNMKLCLGHLGGCLSVVCTTGSHPILKDSIELWVMKEYGVTESWTKVFRMNSPLFRNMNSSFISSRGFLKDGQKILMMTDKTKPFVFDTVTKRMTTIIEIRRYRHLSNFNFFASFVETLVSLKVGSTGTLPIPKTEEKRGRRQLKRRRRATIDTPVAATEVPTSTSVVAEGTASAISAGGALTQSISSAANPVAERPRRIRRRPANLQDYV